MNLLDPYKLKANEELLKYIEEKTKNPPIIITCIGSSSIYNEFSVNKFLTCLKSKSDFKIVEAEVTHDRGAIKGITLWREIYRKNGNPAEDQAFFVFNLSRDNTNDKNYFNKLVAFAKIISSVILQTDYNILWKDIDGKFSKWIENQEKMLNIKARVARSYSEDFCKFGEEIFTYEFAGKVFPEVFGDFVRSLANLAEAGLHPTRILNCQNPTGTMDKLENNSDVDMPNQEIVDQSQSISLKAENLSTLTQSSSSGSTTIRINQGKGQVKFLKQQNVYKKEEIETQMDHKINHKLTQTDPDFNHNETQTDHNSTFIDIKVNEKKPLLILTKNSCLNKEIHDIIIDNIYKKIERKVEFKEIHYSSIDHLLSNFNKITNEILEQFQVYNPENDQNQIMNLGQNLLQPLEFLEKFKSSRLFQNWAKVFKSVDMLCTKLSHDFLKKMKKMQDNNFSGWNLSEWAESLMSNICNKNGINLGLFKRSTNAKMEFPKILKDFQDIIKVIIIYDDEVKNYFSMYMKNSVNAKFEDHISKFLEISIFKAGFAGNKFLNSGEYFVQILNESVKIRSQIIYYKMFPENDRKMQVDTNVKLGKFMKIKFESNTTQSTSKEIKRVANEFKSFCSEYFSAKFQLWHEIVSQIWQNIEFDIEDMVRNTILKMDCFSVGLEKVLSN